MKYIILGDLHFGTKSFSTEVLNQQIQFFKEQLIPYMKKNKIDTIIQLGDFLDNRKSIDINFLCSCTDNFFDYLQEQEIKIITLLGNHDVYHKDSNESNLMKYFGRLYDNIEVIEKRTYMNLGDYKFYVVPWLTKDDNLYEHEMKDVDVILGHFEIRNFQMTKGHYDETSTLTPEYFKKQNNLKYVLSGHYHIKSENNQIKYLGTPYQMNWGDYKDERGFFELDVSSEIKLKFVPNTVSPKHVKLKYNSENKKPLEISGLNKNSINVTHNEFKKYLEKLNKHNIRFFINKTDGLHDEFIYTLKQSYPKEFKIINNAEISEIIGTEFKESTEHDNMSSIELIQKIASEQEDKEIRKYINELLLELKE